MMTTILTSRQAMLIGLMSLPNQVVYIQFHPVAYMVKLNIEMSMASLITYLARNGTNDVHMGTLSESDRRRNFGTDETRSRDIGLKSFTKSRARHDPDAPDAEFAQNGGIQRTREVAITVQQTQPGDRKGHVMFDETDDELSLTSHPGHPTGSVKEVDAGSSSASVSSLGKR